MAGKVTKYLVSIFLDKYLEIRGLWPGSPLRTNKAVFPAGAAVHSSTCFGEERLEELFENVFVCSKNDSFKNLVSPFLTCDTSSFISLPEIVPTFLLLLLLLPTKVAKVLESPFKYFSHTVDIFFGLQTFAAGSVLTFLIDISYLLCV